MTLVCKTNGIVVSLINPIYGCSVKITPDINRTLEMYFIQLDAKNPCWLGIEPIYMLPSSILEHSNLSI